MENVSVKHISLEAYTFSRSREAKIKSSEYVVFLYFLWQLFDMVKVPLAIRWLFSFVQYKQMASVKAKLFLSIIYLINWN